MKTKILFTIAAALTACVFLLSEGVSAANGKTDKKSIRLDVGQAEITEGDSITLKPSITGYKKCTVSVLGK